VLGVEVGASLPLRDDGNEDFDEEDGKERGDGQVGRAREAGHPQHLGERDACGVVQGRGPSLRMVAGRTQPQRHHANAHDDVTQHG